MSIISYVLGRFTTRKRYEDGSIVKELHRYALRYERGERTVDVGFERALEPDVDRLIHLEAFRHWNPPYEKELITSEERDGIIKKIGKYCDAKGLTYRYIGSLAD